MATNEQILKITELVLEINKESAGENGEQIVFLNILPHVSTVEIRIYDNGWSYGYEPRTYNAYYAGELVGYTRTYSGCNTYYVTVGNMITILESIKGGTASDEPHEDIIEVV